MSTTRQVLPNARSCPTSLTRRASEAFVHRRWPATRAMTRVNAWRTCAPATLHRTWPRTPETDGGFRRTRFIGLELTQVAAYLVATAYNLVRMARLVSGPIAA